MGKLSLTGNSAIRSRLAVLPAAAPPVSLATAILALSPVGYWKLNEPSGTTATDSSGNGRNGTYTGSGFTLGGAAGPDGNYVDLGNAASSHIAIADNNAWSISGSGMSWFALLKPDSVAGTTAQYYVSKGSGGNFEWGLNFNEAAGGRLTVTVWTGGGTKIQQATATGMGTAWQAVVVTTADTVNTTVPKVYRNSNTQIGSDAGSSGSGYTNGAAEVRIGWRGDSPANQYWAGGIAHVAIFAANLNTTQIATLTTAADTDGWY